MSYIERQHFSEILDIHKPITLLNCNRYEGNISNDELIILATKIRQKKPLNLLEIGTFDGRTTLQMALNSPRKAIIHTLDLPFPTAQTRYSLDEADVKYIFNHRRSERKYTGSSVQKKIREHVGDSAEFDFTQLIQERPLDFAFIDGSHSYEYVKSDTENVLKILSKKATIFWHDYEVFEDVTRYLDELSEEIPIVVFRGTQLAMHQKE